MSPEREREIEERLSKATKGPWEMRPRVIGGAYGPAYEADCEIVGNVNREYRCSTPVCKLSVGFVTYEGDKQFIAHAPQDIADLLAEVGRLRKALACAENDLAAEGCQCMATTPDDITPPPACALCEIREALK